MAPLVQNLSHHHACTPASMSNFGDTTRGLGFGNAPGLSTPAITSNPNSRDARWEKTRERYHKLFGSYPGVFLLVRQAFSIFFALFSSELSNFSSLHAEFWA